MLGCYSQPRRLPHKEPTVYTTALCYRHENCHANDGSVFIFHASIQKNHWVHVLLMKAGVCRGPLRAFRQSSSQDGEQVVPNLTTEDRRRILHAADDLLADDANPHPRPLGYAWGRRHRHGPILLASRSTWHGGACVYLRWCLC